MKANRQHPASNCITITFNQIMSYDTGALTLEITSIGYSLRLPEGFEAMASPCGTVSIN